MGEGTSSMNKFIKAPDQRRGARAFEWLCTLCLICTAVCLIGAAVLSVNLLILIVKVVML